MVKHATNSRKCHDLSQFRPPLKLLISCRSSQNSSPNLEFSRRKGAMSNMSSSLKLRKTKITLNSIILCAIG